MCLIIVNISAKIVEAKVKSIEDLLTAQQIQQLNEFGSQCHDVHNTSQMELPFLEAKEDRTVLNKYILV